jgi:hypothetical protein
VHDLFFFCNKKQKGEIMHISCPKLFDSEVQVNRKMKRALIRYLRGLILYPGKKNCSAISRSTNISNDLVYEFFIYHVDEKTFLQDWLKRAISCLPLKKGVWYVNIDETLIEKIFSKKIEAVSYNWNSTINDTMKGYAVVAAVITNGKITIPITFKTWYSSKDFPDKHKTRIELAQQLMIDIEKTVPGIMFLMDGAFSSEGMLTFCRTHKMIYCMRFHSNKIVVINGKAAQLRKHEHIKISSNRIGRVVKASYKSQEAFILAFKRKEKSGKIKIVYLVTNKRETPRKTIKAYKKRWGIEKVFRTTKQHLGLRDCQARSAAKQEVHIFAVFVAYAFLAIQKNNHRAKNPEQILHKIRRGKSRQLHDQFETFCGIA